MEKLGTLTLIAADKVCRELGWQGTTNVVHAILHDESIPLTDITGLLPQFPSKWGLSIQAPYAPPRGTNSEFEGLTVHLQVDGANVQAYKMGPVDQSSRFATSPLTVIAEGIRASAFILRVDKNQMGPVHVTARVVLHGIILAEAQLEVPTSEMGGSEIKHQGHQAFTRIFVSYARSDVWVVKLIDSSVSALGVCDLRWDLKVLQAGDDWSKVVHNEICSADSFQLFWSEAARKSSEVRKEWMLALEQNKERFIRPVYWQEPLEPPPAELEHLHFRLLEIPGNVMRGESK